jgi:hypothetical protein
VYTKIKFGKRENMKIGKLENMKGFLSTEYASSFDGLAVPFLL